LSDTDQHDAEASRALGGLQIRARHVLLGGALAKAQHRDLVVGRVTLDRGHIGAALLGQQRRRRDREAAVQPEPHELMLGHQLRHVRLQKQAIDRAHLQRHVIAQ
jgi:hypothetical protein